MLSLFDPLRDLEFSSLFVRLLLAVLCGAAIGLERSTKNRPAGFRTHMLVCLGGACAAVTGHFLYLGLHIPADITRLSGQVITGLGFIGAGTIIVTKKLTIKGLTTAAGLWTTGIIGLALGSGFYEGGLLGTGMVLIIETLMSRLGKRIRIQPEMDVEIAYDDKEALDQVMRYLKDQRVSVKSLQIHALKDQQTKYSAKLLLRLDKENDNLSDEIRALPGIAVVNIEN